MDDGRIQSFPPIVDEQCRVLVLGTMPGIQSLREQRYYAHGRNAFWSAVFALYGQPCPADYGRRTAFLLEKHIALWDVLASCRRQTSADADIREPRPNDVAGLLTAHPSIQAVFLNGNGATALYRSLVLPHLAVPLPGVTLPSTSPAYAIPFERKLAGWQPLREAAERCEQIFL